MLQTRRHPRQLASTSATIVSAEESSGTSCSVLNASDGGLCLLVASADVVPDAFDLIVDMDGSRRSCIVTWRSGNRVGVRFRGGHGASGELGGGPQSAIRPDLGK